MESRSEKIDNSNESNEAKELEKSAKEEVLQSINDVAVEIVVAKLTQERIKNLAIELAKLSPNFAIQEKDRESSLLERLGEQIEEKNDNLPFIKQTVDILKLLKKSTKQNIVNMEAERELIEELPNDKNYLDRQLSCELKRQRYERHLQSAKALIGRCKQKLPKPAESESELPKQVDGLQKRL